MRIKQSIWSFLRPWCWEGLGAGGEGDDRGWDGWMASPTRWTWSWVNSGSWWWTGGLVCCDSWGRKELDTTEQLNWTELNFQNHAWVTGWNNSNQTILILREVSPWSSREDFVLGWRTKDTAKTRSNGWNYFNSLCGAQIKEQGAERLWDVSPDHLAYEWFDKTIFLTVWLISLRFRGHQS